MVVIDGLAFAASVPGLSEQRRQMGSIIECSVDKLRPPHPQISAGWEGRRGREASPPSAHLASCSSWEVSRPRSEPRGTERLSSLAECEFHK